jgi:hypothetical protein
MGVITPDQFQFLLPMACDWAEAQEQLILKKGVPLNVSQVKDAELVGVAYPEKVRILSVPHIPLPDDPALRAAAQQIQLITPATRGLTLRYGIYIHLQSLSDRRLIIHELVHTSQYERLGGFLPFLKEYLSECIIIGYPDAPMEQEAILTADRICRSADLGS